MKKNSGKAKKAANVSGKKAAAVSDSKPKTIYKHPIHRLSLDSDIKVLGAMLFLICMVYVFTYVDFSSMLNPPPKTCENLCGDGLCQEAVCQSVGCPCAENSESCPQDCPKWARVSDDAKTLELTSDEKAEATAVEYVKNLFCFNNYNSSNLKELNFTKTSDENGGTYEASYMFDVDTDLLPENTTAMSVNLIVANGVVKSAKVSRVTENKEGFCGYSTNGPCTSNGDCVTGGCSGQICRSASEQSLMTTCEWKDCYSAEKYNLSCKCMSGQCIWN
jgi:eight-cysteine-cluster-containing protein